MYILYRMRYLFSYLTLQRLSDTYCKTNCGIKIQTQRWLKKLKMEPNPQALLLSSSNCHGFSMLEFGKKDICEILQKNSVTDIIFVPYAQSDYDKYTTTVKEVIDPWGFCVTGIHTFSDPVSAVNSAKAIFVGGGNTFRLLKELYENNLVKQIRHRVNYENLVYIGSSAGTNVATISIHTTNDMPIVYPPTFDSIGIVPFNINPHYIDKPDSVTHRGETRDQRICEYLEMPHAKAVLGLKEGCILEVKGRSLLLKGVAGAVLFEQGQQKRELAIGEEVSYLLNEKRLLID